MDRLQKQMQFLIEIDKLKGILRQSLVLNGLRQENDTEHSWHMSMCAVILKEYFKQNVDMIKVIKMILIHDIVEIMAGDTPAYGSFSAEEKFKNELLAAEKTFGILPENQKNELMALWREFEDMETVESKFANACDRFQGFIQNVTSDAHTWRKFKVTKSKIINRTRPVINYMPEVYYGYIQEYMKKYIENGVVTDDKPVKLIATDLDGTFVNNEKNVPEINSKMINSLIDKGIDFVASSGRDIPSIKDLLKDIKHIKYYSCFNGAKIYKDDRLIYSKNMPKEICEDILKKGVELGLNYSATAGFNVCYTKLDTEYYNEHANQETKYKFFENKDGENVKAFDFEKMVFFGKAEQFKILRSYVEEKYGEDVNIFGSGDNVIDIVDKSCTKGNALRIIADEMKIALDEVMAFGDNENDLDMLLKVGYPVAMRNAKDMVKEKISTITDINENGGVGKYLEEFFKDKI